MNARLTDVLAGEEANYILPFFWQRGEDGATIREEMARIHDSGIGAVCVESRPHPDFLGPKWWHDMDVIMDEARKRGMKVWILDDAHFPTGSAAGKFVDAPKELRRLFLTEKHIDAIGPMESASFMVDIIPYTPGFSDGGLLKAVVAIRRDLITGAFTNDSIDLTSNVEESTLHWDIPEGIWRIFMLIETAEGGSEKQKDYMNPIVHESVRVLIDTVYESFYERYQADFGQTLAGFFSDEPGFYNVKDNNDFAATIGKKGIVLPWSDELDQQLEARLGADYRTLLPLLWNREVESGSLVRFTYMDLVSRLYAKNFTDQIGDWCRDHRVDYIGHVIEDNNAHARLGVGAGHFFRSLWGQDMAGIDVVLWQLVPGFDRTSFTWIGGETDNEFFNYGLAKMASSLGHMDPKKKGRTMCEVFGAYGWSEGLKLMKWMTDHLLVRGVNYFVPHAFSMAEFPDRDCPPHFYAKGNNPQFRYYAELNHYTNRMSHLLTEGQHIASAAVLYHAEAEWSGEAMYFHKPVMALMQNQIDCDVLPVDALIELSSLRGDKLCINEETYDCLIIPYAEALPMNLVTRLAFLANQGLRVLFVDALPIRLSEGEDAAKLLGALVAESTIRVVALAELADYLKAEGIFDIRADGAYPSLRHYHYRHPGMEVYHFFNEHPYQEIEANVVLPVQGRVLFYDAFRNQVHEASSKDVEGGVEVSLRLSPYESIVVLAGEGVSALSAEKQVVFSLKQAGEKTIEGPWLISTATSAQYPAFEIWKSEGSLGDMSHKDRLPRFSGTIRYETSFNWTGSGKAVWLDLGKTYETAELWINDQYLGISICPPYHYDISTYIHQGVNTLRIEVTNTLIKETKDFFSRFAQMEPSGLMGPVQIMEA